MKKDKIKRTEVWDNGQEPNVDRDGDPIFFHPELNEIKTWSQFKVLMPENYGWIVIGVL
jgi:hypothetical protein